MTTIYLLILCLALTATLALVTLYLYDRLTAERHARGTPPWYAGALDRVLSLFVVAAAGLLIGLLLDGSHIDVVDLGAEAMLLAAGATSTERLVARRRHHAGSQRLATPAVCLAAGLIGGLVGLGS